MFLSENQFIGPQHWIDIQKILQDPWHHPSTWGLSFSQSEASIWSHDYWYPYCRLYWHPYLSSWMYLVYPKDHILKVLCPYLYFLLKYMGVNKAYNTYSNSHVTKYLSLIGWNFNPRYLGGAKGLIFVYIIPFLRFYWWIFWKIIRQALHFLSCPINSWF